VSYLVDLAEELSNLNSDINILAIGGGSEFELVQNYAKDSGVLDSNFFMEGYLNKKDMPAALSAATIVSSLFIDIPEMRHNSANKLFDAMAARKPVMINYGGWMHEIVREHNCGLKMWNRSICKVAKELDQSVRDADWFESASKSSTQLAKGFFNRNVLAEKLLSVLQTTAEGNPDRVEAIAPGNFFDK